MGGDPYNGVTATTSGWFESTSVTYYADTTSDYDVYVSYGIGSLTEEQDAELQRKIKELVKKAVILKMKSEWRQDKKEYKPLPILRPTHRLQNICFNGRGWG